MALKPVLFGTELDIRPSDAQAVVRYLVEADRDDAGNDITATLEADPTALATLVKKLPPIGDKKYFAGVQGAPNPPAALASVGGGMVQEQNYTTHELRAYRQRISPSETKNINKVFAEVYYASRARPVIQFGASAVQQKTQTYLTDESGIIGSTDPSQLPADSNDVTYRKQMVLDYILKKGTYQQQATDSQGNVTPPYPAEDITLLKTAVDGTMFRYGDSIQVTSFWFNDECALPQLTKMSQMYTACTNKDALFFTDDAQRWLCTSMPRITTDGGWIWRVSTELVYSPFGWDNYEVYVDPFTSQPAIISDTVLQALYKRGSFNNMLTIPGAYNPKGGGAGRFPQQLCRPMSKMLGFLSQGILFTQPTIDEVLAPTAVPVADLSGSTGTGYV